MGRVKGPALLPSAGNNRYCRLHRAHPSKIAKGGAAICLSSSERSFALPVGRSGLPLRGDALDLDRNPFHSLPEPPNDDSWRVRRIQCLG
jgi:hypothetical protein